MALAFLCHYVKHRHSIETFSRFEFGAFIVDHRVREASKNEAVMTSRRLSSMGQLHVLSTLSLF